MFITLICIIKEGKIKGLLGHVQETDLVGFALGTTHSSVIACVHSQLECFCKCSVSPLKSCLASKKI